MNSKHFRALADAIKYWYADNDEDRLYAAHAIMSVCMQFNPNFDAGRFLTACGVEADE